MSKKVLGSYKYDDDEDYVPTQKVQYLTTEKTLTNKKKHTLDSDEEDEDCQGKQKNYDVLQDDDIDGQESATIDHEGDIEITPFNMNEEMEDGYFDKEGFYHFKKDKDELKDAWLDNIDWIKIRHQEEAPNKYGSDESDLEEDEKVESIFKPHSIANKEIYQQVFQFLNPEETISKALKRLGGNPKKRLTTAERCKLKKQGKLEEYNQTMETFLKLTDAVNEMVTAGNMNIYEETYETIDLKLKQWSSNDMFADDDCPPAKKVRFDLENGIKKETGDNQNISKKDEMEFKDEDLDKTHPENKSKNHENGSKESSSTGDNQNICKKEEIFIKEEMEVVHEHTKDLDTPNLENINKTNGKGDNKKYTESDNFNNSENGDSKKPDTKSLFSKSLEWEYKWENTEESEIHGPFSSQQMLDWKDSDFFKDGAFVRKIETVPGPWYKMQRIDFELYT